MDGAIGVDGEEEIGMENGVIERGGSAVGVGVCGPGRLRQNFETEDEGSGREDALEESATGDIFDCAHAVSLAADLMAARMRW